MELECGFSEKKRSNMLLAIPSLLLFSVCRIWGLAEAVQEEGVVAGLGGASLQIRTDWCKLGMLL